MKIVQIDWYRRPEHRFSKSLKFSKCDFKLYIACSRLCDGFSACVHSDAPSCLIYGNISTLEAVKTSWICAKRDLWPATKTINRNMCGPCTGSHSLMAMKKVREPANLGYFGQVAWCRHGNLAVCIFQKKARNTRNERKKRGTRRTIRNPTTTKERSVYFLRRMRRRRVHSRT